ncbi:hypothetical protein BJ912DRAFT_273453 [Pholiota molesta]|nr:hypothetical protein BJ912DRAFT_273453 [Pholiota molesta]
MKLRSPQPKRTQSEASNANVVKTSKRAQAKKRKTQEEEDHTESMKPLKRGGGLLKDIMEMPMDVLFEIFGQLEPLDLLNIGRTTKALRAILMSRSSTSVWMSARSNVFGLPDCPDDLSEPQYAALMFVKGCTFCQRNIPGIQIFWYARVRCCTKCAKLNFTPASRRPSGDRGCPALLTDWVPFVKVTRKLKRTPTETLYISESIDNQWKNEYWACKDPNSQHEWLLRTISARYLIQKHARACAFWHNAWSNSLDGTDLDRLRSISKQNNAQNMAYIQGISFELEEELYKVPPTKPYPPESLDIQLSSWNQLWSLLQDPKSPSDLHIILLIKNSLPTMLSQSKRHRESLTHRDLLTSRRPFISAIYNNGIIKTLPINSLSPTIGQFYCFAEDHDLIDYVLRD